MTVAERLPLITVEEYLAAELDVLPAFDAELYEGLDAVVTLEEVAAQLPLAELYERVQFPSA